MASSTALGHHVGGSPGTRIETARFSTGTEA